MQTCWECEDPAAQHVDSEELRRDLVISIVPVMDKDDEDKISAGDRIGFLLYLF